MSQAKSSPAVASSEVPDPLDVDVVALLQQYPGGNELLKLSTTDYEVALVGGAVRDLMLGIEPRELDVVVASRYEQFAGALASALKTLAGAEPNTAVHERFHTAFVEWRISAQATSRIDVAECRLEAYPKDGALPVVQPAKSFQEDLQRRDFTINAIAVPLKGTRRLKPICADHAVEDLRKRQLRIVHERGFLEDPTRLLRLARYQARLGFRLESHTAELAAEAAGAEVLKTVSGARIGAELRLALGEANPVAALAAMNDFGLLAALHPSLRFDRTLATSALELLLGTTGSQGSALRPDLLVLAVLLLPISGGSGDAAEAEMVGMLNELQFPGADREDTLRAALCARSIAEKLAVAKSSSEVYIAACNESPAGIALAGAWGELQAGALTQAGSAAREWLARLRGVELEITGKDLIDAGIASGPEVGRRLKAALLRKLDDELDGSGRKAELSAALQATL